MLLGTLVAARLNFKRNSCIESKPNQRERWMKRGTEQKLERRLKLIAFFSYLFRCAHVINVHFSMEFLAESDTRALVAMMRWRRIARDGMLDEHNNIPWARWRAESRPLPHQVCLPLGSFTEKLFLECTCDSYSIAPSAARSTHTHTYSLSHIERQQKYK